MGADNEETMMCRLTEQRKAIEHMQTQIAKYRATLLLIVEWRLPYPSFGFQNGSDGERDYFRNIARTSLD